MRRTGQSSDIGIATDIAQSVAVKNGTSEADKPTNFVCPDYSDIATCNAVVNVVGGGGGDGHIGSRGLRLVELVGTGTAAAADQCGDVGAGQNTRTAHHTADTQTVGHIGNGQSAARHRSSTREISRKTGVTD